MERVVLPITIKMLYPAGVNVATIKKDTSDHLIWANIHKTMDMDYEPIGENSGIRDL